MSFPLKMMSLLNEGHQYSDIICWLPHGRGFTILDKKRFETDVMPKYFQDAKYTSFTRRLRRWNFRIQTHGHKRSSYFHPSFVKGREDLCREMKALPQVRKRRSSSSGMGDGSISTSFPPLRQQGQEYTNGIPCTVVTGGAKTTETTANGNRSMKGPLKKRISTIATSPARPNDSNSTFLNDTHAVVSTNGSCDSSSSVGESVDSSFSRSGEGGARLEKQSAAAAAASSLAMPPLVQPTISAGGNRNHSSHATTAGNSLSPNKEKVVTVATNAGVPVATSTPTVNTVFCYPSSNNTNCSAIGNYAGGPSSLPPSQSVNMLGGMPNPYCQQPHFVSQQPHQLHLQQQQQQQQVMAYCNNSVAQFAAPPSSPYSANTAMIPTFHSSERQHTPPTWSSGPVSQFPFSNNIMTAPAPAPVAPVQNIPNNMCYPMERYNTQPPMGYHPGIVSNNGARGTNTMMQHHHAAHVHQAPQFFHNQNFTQHHPNMMTTNTICNYNGIM